ncbi:MAG TPA: hypothetical protein VG916_08680, partial [Gemmatimonadaceae bacterium]|nr:hypothetical protein [Gemmatimonadaceae bacterium]
AGAAPPPPDVPPPDDARDGDDAPPSGPESSAERELVRVMLLQPDLVERIVEEVARLETDDAGVPDVDGAGAAAPAVMRDPVYAPIFRAIAGATDPSPETLAEGLSELENHVVETLRSEPGAIVDPGRTIVDAIRMLRARALRERLDEHARMLPLADEADKPALLRQEADLRKELAAVGGRDWHSVRRLRM